MAVPEPWRGARSGKRGDNLASEVQLL